MVVPSLGTLLPLTWPSTLLVHCARGVPYAVLLAAGSIEKCRFVGCFLTIKIIKKRKRSNNGGLLFWTLGNGIIVFTHGGWKTQFGGCHLVWNFNVTVVYRDGFLGAGHSASWGRLMERFVTRMTKGERTHVKIVLESYTLNDFEACKGSPKHSQHLILSYFNSQLWKQKWKWWSGWIWV